MFVFFFQAEDGIRDGTVTGVQTCALPIWAGAGGPGTAHPSLSPTAGLLCARKVASEAYFRPELRSPDGSGSSTDQRDRIDRCVGVADGRRAVRGTVAVPPVLAFGRDDFHRHLRSGDPDHVRALDTHLTRRPAARLVGAERHVDRADVARPASAAA